MSCYGLELLELYAVDPNHLWVSDASHLLHLYYEFAAIDYTAAYCYRTTSNDIAGHC